MIIKSKRFIIRSFKKGDEKSLQKNINDRGISRFITNIPYPYKLKDAKTWINHCTKISKSRNKKEVIFALDINGEVVGGVGLSNIEIHKAEIGYWLARKLQNRGFMTEALRLVTNFGFNELKLKRIYATVDPKNNASIQVLEKNKYKREGLLRKLNHKNGRFLDRLMYAKIK